MLSPDTRVEENVRESSLVIDDEDERVFHYYNPNMASSSADVVSSWAPAPPSEPSMSLELPAPLKARVSMSKKGGNRARWQPAQAPKMDASGKQTALWVEDAPGTRHASSSAISKPAATAKNYIVGGIDCLAVVRRLKGSWLIPDKELDEHNCSGSSKSKSGSQVVVLSDQERNLLRKCNTLSQHVTYADKAFDNTEHWLDAIMARPWRGEGREEEWARMWGDIEDVERRASARRRDLIALAVKRTLRVEQAFKRIDRAQVEIVQAARKEGILDSSMGVPLNLGKCDIIINNDKTCSSNKKKKTKKERENSNQKQQPKTATTSLVFKAATSIQKQWRGGKLRKTLGEFQQLELAELEAALVCDPDESKFRLRNNDALNKEARRLAVRRLKYMLETERRRTKGASENSTSESRPLTLVLLPGLEVAQLCAGLEMGMMQQYMGTSFELYTNRLWAVLCQLRAEITRAEAGSTVLDFCAALKKKCLSFDGGDGRVAREDLSTNLAFFCPSVSVYEREMVLTYWDARMDGLITLDRVAVSLRGALSDRRQVLCNFAFDRLCSANDRHVKALESRLDRLNAFYNQFAPKEAAKGKALEAHRRYKDTEKINKDLFTKLYSKYVPWLKPPEHLWSRAAQRREQESMCTMSVSDVRKLYNNFLNADVLSNSTMYAKSNSAAAGAKNAVARALVALDKVSAANVILHRADWLALHAEISAGIEDDLFFEHVVCRVAKLDHAEWLTLAERQARRDMCAKDRDTWFAQVRQAEQAKLQALQKTSLTPANFASYVRDLDDVLRKVRGFLVSVCGTTRSLADLEKEIEACSTFGDDRKVSKQDFKHALGRFGITLSRDEVSLLQTHYGAGSSNNNNDCNFVSVDAFLCGVQDSEARRWRNSRAANESNSAEDFTRRQARWLRAISATILPEDEKEWVRYMHKGSASNGGMNCPFWYCKITGERTWIKPKKFSRNDRHEWEQQTKKRVRYALGLLNSYRESASHALNEQVDLLEQNVCSAMSVVNASLLALPDSMLQSPSVRRLSTLVLDYNKLEAVPPCIGQLEALRRLSLRGNKLTSLPEAQFKSSMRNAFHGLVSLCLSHNKLAALPKSLGELSALQELELDYNLLTGLFAASFTGLHDLRALDLEGNRIRTLPADEECWRTLGGSLQWISLRNNQLSTVPDAFGAELCTTTFLDLRDNRIQSMPETFGAQLDALKQLHLEGNNLLSLPGGVGRCAGLKKLFLQHNALTMLPETICELRGLKELHINNNRLITLPERLVELEQLETLRAQCNRLTALPKKFGLMHCLTDFWAHQNDIEVLSRDIPAALKTLKLHNNCLTEVPAVVGEKGAANLTHLDLAGNQIKSLPISFYALDHMTYLRLDDNPLEETLAKIVATGRFSTKDEQNYGLLLRKLIDSIKSTMDLQGRIDTALGISVEEAMREATHQVRERLQHAKEVKLGINSRKRTAATNCTSGSKTTAVHVDDGEREDAEDAAAMLDQQQEQKRLDDQESALDDALRKGRSIVQQALSLGLRRFSQAHGGNPQEISQKAFHHCIQVIGSLLSAAEVDRLCARVFQLFDTCEIGKITFDLFVVSIRDAVRTSAGLGERGACKSSNKQVNKYGNTGDLPDRAIGMTNLGRHRDVASAVLRYCSAMRAKAAMASMTRLGEGGNSPKAQQRLSKQQQSASAELEMAKVKILAERNEEREQELSQLRRQLTVASKLAKIVQECDRMDPTAASATAAISPKLKPPSAGVATSPRQQIHHEDDGDLAIQADKADLRCQLRSKSREIQELKRALQQTKAVARYYTDEMGERYNEIKTRENKRREKRTNQVKMKNLSEKAKQAAKRKRAKQTKIKTIFTAHARKQVGGHKYVLSKGDMISAAGEVYREFGCGRLGLEPKQWRLKLLHSVENAFHSGYKDEKTGRFMAFDKQDSGVLDLAAFQKFCNELERCIVEESGQGVEEQKVETVYADVSGHHDTPCSSTKGCTVMIDFIASVGKVVPITLRSYNETCASLKAQIAFAEAIPKKDQLLLFKGERLEDHQTLKRAGIRNGDKVKLVLYSKVDC